MTRKLPICQPRAGKRSVPTPLQTRAIREAGINPIFVPLAFPILPLLADEPVRKISVKATTQRRLRW